MITQLFGKIRTRRNPCANLRKVFDSYFNKKSSELFVDSRKCLSLHRQIPPASHKNSVPSGTFLCIDMRYTKQAMTLAQQILTLQGRGLMNADTNKAEQALDAI